MQSARDWQLKFWRLPHLDDLELLHALNVTHNYPAHMHEWYSIAVVLRGIEETICRGTSHQARRGDLILINAEQVHSNRSVGSEYRLIKVPPDTFERLLIPARDTSRRQLFRNLVVTEPHLFESLLNLHLKLEQDLSALEHQSEFVSAMALLFEKQVIDRSISLAEHTTRKEQIHIRRVRDYLRANYAENVSLSKLTSLTHLSPFYLLRVFRQSTGFPPHEYQTQLRIAHARKLIRDGMSLSQIALETGFFDQSHLSRNFKRIVGVTPRQYFHRKPLAN